MGQRIHRGPLLLFLPTFLSRLNFLKHLLDKAQEFGQEHVVEAVAVVLTEGQQVTCGILFLAPHSFSADSA